MLEAVCGALGVFVVGAVELGALALLIELGLKTVRADDECVGVCSLVLGEEEVVVEVGGDEIPGGKQVSQQQNGTIHSAVGEQRTMTVWSSVCQREQAFRQAPR